MSKQNRTATVYEYEGRQYTALEIAEALAADGLPVCPGELGNPAAADLMLRELVDNGDLRSVGIDRYALPERFEDYGDDGELVKMPYWLIRQHHKLNEIARDSYRLRDLAHEPTVVAFYQADGDRFFAQAIAISQEWENR